MKSSNIKNPVVRLADENDQILREESPAEAVEWLRLSCWKMDDACKLITVGSPETYNLMAEFGANQEPGTWGRDQFESMHFVFCKAKSIASASVHCKSISDPDTSANWIAWARSNGYCVSHLLLGSILSNLKKLQVECNDEGRSKLLLGQMARAERVRKLSGEVEERSADQLAPQTGGPMPLSTGEVAFAFGGLNNWSEKQWKKPLGNKPVWLKRCVAIPGSRGKHETRWNPVFIGAALVKRGKASIRSVRAKFQTHAELAPWLEEWKSYEASIS